jgi:5-oxoprolinase (ATP-hydrolysing) subunit A
VGLVKWPDLNIDLGEIPDEPTGLYSLASRVNVACGGHAGTPETMRLACERALAKGAHIGAHPSYPDQTHFGRFALDIGADLLRASLEAQCRALDKIARGLGAHVEHVKPHGALYHRANQDAALAHVVVEVAVRVFGSPAIVGPPRGELRKAALDGGVPFLAEGFADRGYAPDGALLPRGAPGSLLDRPEAAAAQARRLAQSGEFDTLCVHGDTPNALAIARAVREALDRG